VTTTQPAVALRDRTRQTLLELIRRSDGITRAEIATTTGFSRSTVGSAVGSLLASGLVVEAAVEEKGKGTGRGRPGTILRAAPRGLHVAGVDFGDTQVAVAIADERGLELGRAARSIDPAVPVRSAIELIDIAAELLETLRGELSVSTIGTVVASVPRPLDSRTGMVRVRAAADVWNGLYPAAELGRRLEGAVAHAVNDTVLAAVGEMRHGAARPYRDFIYVKASTGIGASMVFDGAPYLGALGIAGGIGHSKVPGRNDLCHRCGRRGCLETAAGLGAVREQIALTHPGADADLALAEPDAVTERILDEAGRVLGSTLAHSSNLLNPAAIIVGGELGSGQPAFLAGLTWSLRELTRPDIGEETVIVVSELGADAELAGAVTRAAELSVRDDHLVAAA